MTLAPRDPREALAHRLDAHRAHPGTALGVERGSAFGFADRVGYGFSADGKDLVDYSDWEARDLAEMLRHSARARMIDSALTLPLIAAEWKISAAAGGQREAAFVTKMFATDNCATALQTVIDQASSAIAFRKAFWELVYTPGRGELSGRTVYAKVAWRPQSTCRPKRHPRTGELTGFEQDAYYPAALAPAPAARNAALGPVQIDNLPGRAPCAFVYVNGKRQDPINGISELEIAYWAHKTKQKILLLWFQYLENVSLPRTVLTGQDEAETAAAAATLANTRGGGVAPLFANGGKAALSVDQLDVSGKGADQFLAAIGYLDAEAANSVLAGFLDMPSNAAAGGGGAYALSRDASDFYLQAEEARLSEISDGIRDGLFAPICYLNFGPAAKVPYLRFEPLASEDKDRAFALLSTALAGQSGGPAGFVKMLAAKVAAFLGLDPEAVNAEFDQAAADAKAAAEQAAALATEKHGSELASAATARKMTETQARAAAAADRRAELGAKVDRAAALVATAPGRAQARK